METSNKLTGEQLNDLTLFAVDTLASHSAPQANDEELTTHDTFGLGSETVLATYDPDTQSWKTSGDISLWGEQPSLDSLPKSGMTRNGVLYQQPEWVPPTAATASSWWPTPTVDDSKNVTRKSGVYQSLTRKVQMWPTPRAGSMCGGTGAAAQIEAQYLQRVITSEERQAMRAGNGGKLNPMWVEWLMGFPLGWTDLED